MSLISLKEALIPAMEQGYGVGAFDTADFTFTEGIIKAAEETGKPIILMIPSYFFDREGLESYFQFNIDRIRKSDAKIVYHLDHGDSFETVMKAIHWGCNSVMFDGSKLPFEENIKKTKEVVRAAHAAGVEVEAEIGHVAAPEGSIEGSTAKEEFFTKPEDAKKFVDETGVDALAVAVGTVHGVYKGEPKLDYERLKAIKEIVEVPLVMHGGSGLPEKDFKNAINLGITKINFFTEMMMEAVSNVYEMLKEKDGRARYLDLNICVEDTVKKCVKEQMDIFETKVIK
ncbi:class II fructose-bisphosphate aldolase [uncultured Anaerofustis sp.]|uniref:class II fructose-bisphosphate aldolase n=1 Tax=uncultured Anaerofustis sp. TaxID=904996 RepID=UPI0025E40320|nr:class II fructose-bisphosphate aldolase [uncultured Anaerofustis sp.]